MRRFVLAVVIAAVCACSCWGADLASLEREANVLRVELNRLGSSGDPFEREALLRRIIDTCKGTEEAEESYWDLADLYLNGFPSERRQDAIEILELCLKDYPNTNRSIQVKCRLVDMYDARNARRGELVRQLRSDNRVPEMIRSSLN